MCPFWQRPSEDSSIEQEKAILSARYAQVGFLRLMFDVSCKLVELAEVNALAKDVEELKKAVGELKVESF